MADDTTQDQDQPALSERKRAANRRNAAKSTGPRSKEGKKRARFNALKHGMAATSVAILGPETVKAVRRLLRRLRKELRPKNFDEERLVEEKALIYTRLGWCARADATAFAIASREERDRQQDGGVADDDEPDDAEDEAGLKYFAFPDGGHMKKRARYERELRARLQTGTRELQKLQRARQALEEEEEAAAAEA